jgi:glycerophosphoryl diester phosphodiesterase
LTIIAHCGACTALADNSLEALHLAVAEGADMVELDLRRTADGRIVVIHDATTFRMMGSGGTVAQMTFAEIRSLRGPKGERIASLEEVLALPLPIIHEFKVRGFEEELAKAIAKRPGDIVSSYDHASLDTVRAFDAGIRLGYLWFRDDWRAVIEKAAAARAYSVHPSNYEVCPELVTLAHANGLKVHVWSVGDAARSTQLRSWGVDGIMTYTPRQTRDLIRDSVGPN